MSQVIVAKRYADALFQLAEDKNLTNEFVKELNVVETVFKQNEKFASLLASPNATNADKLALIDTAFNSVHVYIKNELKIMVERRRSDVILPMINEFTNLYNEKNDIAHAVVSSVRELSSDEISNVETTFKQLLNKQSLIIENKVDKSLLGGLRIRIGNTIYDGSLSNKLKRIEQNLLTANK
ncbi:MAG TPA: F0F1 ATP synthase subunit delta [Pseudogracilibacillus sp.]|nr:F0F1 ATP synthase subunit delta [Pseudogracilibacillus sp.]